MLYVVGIGPGNKDNMTFEAKRVLEECEVIVGYKTYIDLVKDMIGDKEVVENGMRGEIERVRSAIEIAKTGKKVAVISSGDAGVYAMAGLVLELLEEDIPVEIISGVTASTAAAAILGAPLMHDFCHISLSDLMTPYELIKKRVELAGEGDFVICFYNPRSQGRKEYLREAFEVLKKHKSKDTVVGLVKHASREDQESFFYTLETMDFEKVDMSSIVIVGNASTYLKNGRMITKRGYENKENFR